MTNTNRADSRVDFDQERAELAWMMAELCAPGGDENLARLRGWLVGRFWHEEQVPLAAARLQAPELTERVDTLVREHRYLVATLLQLEDDPRRGALLERWIAELRAHERRESELLAEAAYRETGAAN